MLHLALAAALCLPAAQDTTGPKPEEIEKARVELDRALDRKEVEAMVAALTAYGRTPAPKVVDQVERGLAHKEREVQAAAIEALRYNAHADALEALHRVLKKDKKRANLTECISCHVTGYGYQGGFVDLRKTPELGEVSCEACHGVGGNHVAAQCLGHVLMNQ